MAIERLLERLKQGETISAIVPGSGLKFRIRPEYPRKLHLLLTTVYGYSIVLP